jgi:hypothetical protein
MRSVLVAGKWIGRGVRVQVGSCEECGGVGELENRCKGSFIY